MELRDKVVLITGASRGIGAEAAHVFASRGCRVVAGARSVNRLEALCDAVRADGGRARAVALDVTSDASVADAVGSVLANEGAVDVLVNNAGNGGSLEYFLQTPAATARDLFDVHLLGTERMIRATLPAMLERSSGRVVNVVSTVAYVPMPGAAAYCAAKAAVIALTRALQGELVDTAVDIALFSPPHTQTDAGREWPLNMPREFSAEYAAAALVGGVEKDRREWLAGGNQSLLWLQRLSPSMAAGIMRRLGNDATRKARVARAGSPG